jgi:hypothetical protein
MAAQRMITIDQADQLVLDFYRCAMLPAGRTGVPTTGPAMICPLSAPTRLRRTRSDGAMGRRGFPKQVARSAL